MREADKPIIERLEKVGVEFESGLTEDEFERIEKYFDIKFPPDYIREIQQNLETK